MYFLNINLIKKLNFKTQKKNFLIKKVLIRVIKTN
jgi:hypothetical protein